MQVSAINNVQYGVRKANRASFGSGCTNCTPAAQEPKKSGLSPASKKALIAGVVGIAASFLVRRGAAETSILLDNAGKLTDKAATHTLKTIGATLLASQVATGVVIASPIINLIDKVKAKKELNKQV